MKLITFLALFISLASFAQTKLTMEEQTALVEKIAKAERRFLWGTGHDYVGSTVQPVTKDSLDAYIKDNHLMEEPLDKSQIASLYKCNNSKNCNLFLIHVSASYMGGDGSSRVWVMLNPYSGHSKKFKHLVYAE
jgi:hypothetical protein